MTRFPWCNGLDCTGGEGRAIDKPSTGRNVLESRFMRREGHSSAGDVKGVEERSGGDDLVAEAAFCGTGQPNHSLAALQTLLQPPRDQDVGGKDPQLPRAGLSDLSAGLAEDRGSPTWVYRPNRPPRGPNARHPGPRTARFGWLKTASTHSPTTGLIFRTSAPQRTL